MKIEHDMNSQIMKESWFSSKYLLRAQGQLLPNIVQVRPLSQVMENNLADRNTKGKKAEGWKIKIEGPKPRSSKDPRD